MRRRRVRGVSGAARAGRRSGGEGGAGGRRATGAVSGERNLRPARLWPAILPGEPRRAGLRSLGDVHAQERRTRGEGGRVQVPAARQRVQRRGQGRQGAGEEGAAEVWCTRERRRPAAGGSSEGVPPGRVGGGRELHRRQDLICFALLYFRPRSVCDGKGLPTAGRSWPWKREFVSGPWFGWRSSCSPAGCATPWASSPV